MTAAAEEREARLLLTYLLTPGEEAASGSLADGASAVDVLARAVRDPGRTAKDPATVPVGELPDAAEMLDRLADVGERFVVPGDEEWPAGADDLVRARGAAKVPFGLYVRGPHRLDGLAPRAVAVVGSRACTGYGAHVASEIAAGLVERDRVVVSGGAFGIDAAAHRAALGLGGVTVAVLAGGLDVPYPVAHTSLLERIGREGLVVSESPPGSRSFKDRFLSRNRLIAALSRGTVVVEAGYRSGALSTARHAQTIGRMLCAVPGPVTSALSVGCHLQIRDEGALLVSSAADVLDAVSRMGEDPLAVDLPPRTPWDLLPQLHRSIVEAMPRTLPVARIRLEERFGTGTDTALHLLAAGGWVKQEGRDWHLVRMGGA